MVIRAFQLCSTTKCSTRKPRPYITNENKFRENAIPFGWGCIVVTPCKNILFSLACHESEPVLTTPNRVLDYRKENLLGKILDQAIENLYASIPMSFISCISSCFQSKTPQNIFTPLLNVSKTIKSLIVSNS